jgi:hypothetical protein
MKFTRRLLAGCLGVYIFCSLLNAQQPSASASPAVVPRLVNFSGRAADTQGKIITGIAGATFAIYSDEYEGAALWLETQNIQADGKGNYTVQLGATKPDGLPLDLFTSGEARWLGVTINNGSEQPRILLLSVPYALKAADAETIGGLPPSAFVLAAEAKGFSGSESATVGAAPGASAATIGSATAAANQSPEKSSKVTTTGGTVNTIPLFTTATNIQNSLLTQTGTTAVNVGGQLNMFALGTATASKGFDSQPDDFVASVFNSSTGKAVSQTFQLQAEPVNNDTSSASGSLSLLYASGTGTPAETGLNISNTGSITATGLFISTTSALPLFAASSNDDTPVIEGLATSKTGSTVGVDGATNSSASNAYGVFGAATASSGSPIGVYGLGQSTLTTSIGVFGQYATESATGAGFLQQAAGVWGDGSTGDENDGGEVGVLGTIDNGHAGLFMSNGGAVTLKVVNNSSNGQVFEAASGSGNSCFIFASGDLSCTGTKNALVPVDGGQRTVAMSAIESPENWFEDLGSAKLVNGVAVVELDPTFIQTVNSTIDYKVFPVPNGDCKGLYVTKKTATSFEVRELGGGTSSIAFDYRITALRLKYENVRFMDRTHDMELSKQMRERLKRTGAKPQSHDPAKATQATPTRAALKPNLAAATAR